MADTEVLPLPYSALACQPRRPLAALIPLPQPLTLFVDVCDLCQLRCAWCPQSRVDFYTVRQGPHLLPESIWRALIMDLVAQNWRPKLVNLYGFGEPLLHPGIVRMAGDAKAIADRVILSTNALALTPAIFEGLMNADLDYLRVSLYPPHAERVRETLTQCKTSRNERGVHKPFIYVKSFGVPGPDNRQAWAGAVDEFGVEPMHHWKRGPQTAACDQACAYPFYAPMIHADGQVSACCADWDRALVIGDLRGESFGNIWRGERLRKLWQRALISGRRAMPECAECTVCHGQRDQMPLDPVKAAALSGGN